MTTNMATCATAELIGCVPESTVPAALHTTEPQ